jgi:hypothetical protein
VIRVRIEDQLSIREILLEDERVHSMNDHVVAAVHHERGLSDLLQGKRRDLSSEHAISEVPLAVPERPFHSAKDRGSLCAPSAARDISFQLPGFFLFIFCLLSTV